MLVDVPAASPECRDYDLERCRYECVLSRHCERCSHMAAWQEHYLTEASLPVLEFERSRR